MTVLRERNGMSNKPIKSYEEFERTYFPDRIRKRELEDETPEETGRRIAREILEDVLSEYLNWRWV